MGKKNSASTAAAAKAAKKVKALQKVERKDKKKVTNSKSKGKGKAVEDPDSDDDLEGILEKMRREWEEAHLVTEELVEGPPSRRANATLTACPLGNHLWCIGGEFFSEDGKAYFYNDVFRYSPEKDEWRKFVSPTSPGPRSAHATVASSAGGGKIFVFGGEFSSLHQNTFHHYRDFWCFDIATHSWDRIDTKIRPSARSGHRMAIWKHFVILFGGFYDPGITTRYLNDLWAFDTQEYTWRQIEFRETDLKPSPRSGFSFLTSADGIILHGGYCKEYMKGKRPVGVMLEDTWFLKLSLPTVAELEAQSNARTNQKSKSLSSKVSGPLLISKWERRKRPSDAFAPPLRSGCTMTLWAARSTGVMFGGVTDEDTNEETLESVFWNDLYGYQLSGKGRWVSMALKQPKAKGGPKKKKRERDNEDDEEDSKNPLTGPVPYQPIKPGAMSDDPNLTVPLPRYNTMLAVLRNTLYLYGGIFERGSREYTLDDFHSLQLDKMDRFTCLKESDVVIPTEGEDESSSDDDEDDDDDDGETDGDDEFEDEGDTLVGDVDHGGTDDIGEDDYVEKLKSSIGEKKKEVEFEAIGNDLSSSAYALGEGEAEIIKDSFFTEATTPFMGVTRDNTLSSEDAVNTPLPGETLAMFYARSRDYWTQKVHGLSDNRGKQLRRDGFATAKERYESYRPMLVKVEKILAEAGLDEEEMRRGVVGGGTSAGGVQSRNRR